MIRLAREFRLVPAVVVAAASLLALKSFGLVLDGGYTLGQPRSAQAEVSAEPAAPGAAESDNPPAPKSGLKPGDPKRSDLKPSDSKPDRPNAAAPTDAPRTETPRSWAQDMFGYPDHTGTVPAPKPAPPSAAAAAPAANPEPADTNPRPSDAVTYDPDRPAVSAGERAVLESLNQRRLALEARQRELDVRESLLAAAEKRIEARLGELKELEARINAVLQKKDEADAARFKGLVTMYENMKAKDAAKIFDRLDMKILLEVATQINPRRMSDILAQMSPEAAERLTTAIASRSDTPKGKPASELPKIEGRPSGT